MSLSISSVLQCPAWGAQSPDVRNHTTAGTTAGSTTSGGVVMAILSMSASLDLHGVHATSPTVQEDRSGRACVTSTTDACAGGETRSRSSASSVTSRHAGGRTLSVITSAVRAGRGQLASMTMAMAGSGMASVSATQPAGATSGLSARSLVAGYLTTCAMIRRHAFPAAHALTERASTTATCNQSPTARTACAEGGHSCPTRKSPSCTPCGRLAGIRLMSWRPRPGSTRRLSTAGSTVSKTHSQLSPSWLLTS